MDMLRGGWGPGMLGNGVGVATGGGSSYAAETEAIAAAFTTPPTTARKNLIDACVVSLKSAGVWAKLDALYAFAAADSQAAKINWIAPGTYNATEVNSPAFTADLGYTGADTKKLSTSFNPTTAPSPKFIQNSGSAFGWATNNVNPPAGMVGTPLGIVVAPRYSTNVFYAHINTNLTNVSAASTDGTGFWVGTRTSSSLTTMYKNGVSVGTDTAAPEAVRSEVVQVLEGAGSYWTGGQCAAAGIGAGLTGAEQLALYNALNTYMQGLYTAANAETNAIASAFTTYPTPARKALIDTCVGALKSAGVWTKLDALYAFAAADSQAAKINWEAPGTYNATEVNAPAFTADQGFTGASTKYLDSGFNAATAPTPKYVQNDASVFGWALNNVAGALLGTGVAGNIVTYPRHSTNCYLPRINTTATDTSYGNSDSIGFWSTSRASSTTLDAYKNGVSQFASAQTSVAVENATTKFLIGVNSSDYWIGGQVAAGGFGSNLTSADHLALYNALRTYLTGVGVP